MQTRIHTPLTYLLLAGATAFLGVAPLRAVDIDYTSTGLYVWAPQEKDSIDGFVCINHLEDSSSFAVRGFHRFASHSPKVATPSRSEPQESVSQNWKLGSIQGQAGTADEAHAIATAPASAPTFNNLTVVPEPCAAALGLLGLLAISLRHNNPKR